VSYGVNGFRDDSCCDWAPFVLVVVVALFLVPVFIQLFQKFPNFCVQICGLGLGLVYGIGLRVRFRFTTFLPSVVQSTAHLSWISVMLWQRMNKFSKMKVHWWTYNLSLFVLHLVDLKQKIITS